MTSPGTDSRTITVRMLAQIAGYVDPLKRAIQTTKDFRGELTAAAKAGKLDDLANNLTKVGLVAVAAFGASIYKMAEFEKQMSEVASVSYDVTKSVQENAEAVDQLREAALRAGAATQYSATQAAQAEAELAKAGLNAADILGGALDGALALAAAGGLDLAEAADTAAKAMNIFGLHGDDVTHIADVLAAAANKSATDVHELAYALRSGGLAAKNAGLSLEETVGTLSAFADNALIGQDAGTSFKAMLIALSAPSTQASALMKQLGIDAYDAGGNFVGLEKFASNLRFALGGLTQEQRNSALATIFGADAMRAATVLYNEGGAGIREYTDAVNDQGAAARTAGQKTDNLAGDVERLTGSLETLFITSGEGANGGLRLLVQMVGGLVDAVGSVPGPILTAGTVLIGLTGLAALGTAGWIKYQAALAKAEATLIAMGPAGAKAAIGMRKASSAAGILAIALLALSSLWDTTVGRNFPEEHMSGALEAIDAKATELVKSGHAADAIKAVTQLAHQQGLTYGEILTKLPAYVQALRDAGDATAGQATAALDATQYTLAMGGAFGNAASEVDGLRHAFDRLNGPELDQREALRNAAAGADRLREALKASGGSMDITTEKGRAAQAALDAMAQNAADVAQTTLDQTHSVDAANAAWQQQVQVMHDILAAAGYSEEAIQNLINQVAKIPEYKKVTIDAKVRLTMSSHGFGVLAGLEAKAKGGITYAADGLITRPAQIRSTPVMWAEAGTEAYIPQGGDDARALGIANEAAGWHGGMVVPKGWTGSGASYASAVGVTVRVVPAPGVDRGVVSALLDAVRFETETSGGSNVQGFIGQRGRR